MQIIDSEPTRRGPTSWWGFVVCLAIAIHACVHATSPPAAAQPAGESDARDAATAQQIQQWVESLESETYAVREFATKRLIAAESAAVLPVFEAIETGELETIARGNYILRQLAVSGDTLRTQEAAFDALTDLANRRSTIVSRRATASLQTVYEVRQTVARQQLEAHGAKFDTLPPVVNGLTNAYASVQFDDGWKGTNEDLRQLFWLTRYRDEAEPMLWMVSMTGSRVNDDWLSLVASLENVGRVKLKHAKISPASLAQLGRLKDLEILELLYSPVDDEAIDYLATLDKVKHLRLIGNQISADGAESLAQQIPQAEVDFKQGGFLGVRCDDAPCRILFVQPNSAAAQARFRIGDVITKYDDRPVATMTELAKMIAEHDVDKVVSIEVVRGARAVTVKDVKLGEWD